MPDRQLQFPSLRAIRAEQCRRHHIEFMQQTWQRPDPFIIGQHTRAICEKIDWAIQRFREGVSSFIIVMVPIRHGKSDMLSRYLPAKFLGEFPDLEVMLVSYGADLSETFSRDAQRILQSPQYRALFPGVDVAKDMSSVTRWGIQGHMGGMVAVGFGGAMTGKGYSLGLCDDYVKDRQEAESALIRQRTWDSFTQDFLTRRAPVSITFALATPWHTDDVIGRAKKAMKDPAFPRFEIVRFPAYDEGDQKPPYDQGILFPERFPRAWYDAQKATLGTYGTAGLLQCNPKARSGNILKIDKVQIHDEAPEGLRWVRAWDLASTEKEILKSDPDWTAGILEAVKYETVAGVAIPHLWIKHVLRGQWEAPERDRRIVQIAQMDGPGVRVGTESVAGYKDTYTRLKETLSGVRNVDKIVPATDKLVRVNPLEPIFEVGNVHLIRGDWNQAFLDECGEFPSGAHDDQVDAMSCGWKMASKEKLYVFAA